MTSQTDFDGTVICHHTDNDGKNSRILISAMSSIMYHFIMIPHEAFWIKIMVYKHNIHYDIEMVVLTLN